MKFIADFFSYLFTLMPVIITYTTGYFFLQTELNLMCKILLFPLIVIFAFITTIFLFRMALIPKMRAGVYRPGFNRGFLAWFLHFALARAIHVAKLKEVIYSFYLFKFLYWRAMGAKVAFNIDCSMTIELRDFPLISVEEGCTLTDGTLISCHIFVNDKLFLKEVTVGKKTYIGMHTVLGAGTTIGDNCFIGGYNKMHNTKVKDNTKIENFEWEKGKP